MKNIAASAQLLLFVQFLKNPSSKQAVAAFLGGVHDKEEQIW